MENIKLENYLMEFAYNSTDKFDNEWYVFKITHEAELCKIRKTIKKLAKDEIGHNWLYEKDDDTYIKVKKQHIKFIGKFRLEKDRVYKTHLNLKYYDYKDKKGYFAQMFETYVVSDDMDTD